MLGGEKKGESGERQEALSRSNWRPLLLLVLEIVNYFCSFTIWFFSQELGWVDRERSDDTGNRDFQIGESHAGFAFLVLFQFLSLCSLLYEIYWARETNTKTKICEKVLDEWLLQRLDALFFLLILRIYLCFSWTCTSGDNSALYCFICTMTFLAAIVAFEYFCEFSSKTRDPSQLEEQH